MAETTLLAKANVGAGTDLLQTFLTVGGAHAGGVVLVDTAGVPVVPATAANQAAMQGTLTSILAASPQDFAVVSSNITANGQTAFCDVRTAGYVRIMVTAASLVGHNATFEASIDSTNGTDGTWFGIQVLRSNANTVELTTGVLAATPAYAWAVSTNGLSFVRARATAHTSGTATWAFHKSSYAVEPVPASQVTGTQTVTISGSPTLAASTNLIGDVGIQARANATGAGTAFNLVSAASTNATVIKASAGRLLGYHFTNNGLATAYVKLHNVATTPVAGTTAVAITIGIQPAASVALSIPAGTGFTAGIALTTSVDAANSGTTGVGANVIVGHLVYA